MVGQRGSYKAAQPSRGLLLQSHLSMKIKRKIQDEHGLYLGLLPPGKEVAQNSVLDLNFSQQNFGEDAPYTELWFPLLVFSDKNNVA